MRLTVFIETSDRRAGDWQEIHYVVTCIEDAMREYVPDCQVVGYEREPSGLVFPFQPAKS